MLLITCFVFGLLGSLTWAGPHGRTVCPSGTFAYKDGSEWNCYKFYEDLLTFEEAEEECQFRWKGHLASFSSDKQAKSVGNYVTRENREETFVWIGLLRNGGSSLARGWHWLDGSRSRYIRWTSGEPNELLSNSACTALYSPSGHLTWHDLYCNYKYPFLCKWKPS